MMKLCALFAGAAIVAACSGDKGTGPSDETPSSSSSGPQHYCVYKDYKLCLATDDYKIACPSFYGEKPLAVGIEEDCKLSGFSVVDSKKDSIDIFCEIADFGCALIPEMERDTSMLAGQDCFNKALTKGAVRIKDQCDKMPWMYSTHAHLTAGGYYCLYNGYQVCAPALTAAVTMKDNPYGNCPTIFGAKADDIITMKNCANSGLAIVGSDSDIDIFCAVGSTRKCEVMPKREPDMSPGRMCVSNQGGTSFMGTIQTAGYCAKNGFAVSK
ncbi:MAG: hypothetical protein LBG89_03665 [Rickettsiales bacterium]|jgi:hypothetical protein|nr:hypothetical protein [Rickettsiales bacterium]